MAAVPADDLSIAERVDAECDRFEAEFQSGQNPTLEQFLGDLPEPLRLQLFRALLELELELRRKAGEQPQPQEYANRFPDYSTVVELVLADVSAGMSPHASPSQADNSSIKMAASETSQAPRRSPASSRSEVPKQVARFQIQQLLGEGAFGAVYRARDPKLDREVAIKLPHIGTLAKQEDRDRFLREARAAASLHHPHICPVHEVGTTPDGRDYIVMAYIDGKSLSKVIQSGVKLTERQVASVIRKLAVALEEAHQKGVIHRDLKPANIMINRKGEPVIMDFGLARRSAPDDPQLSHSGQIMGTPAYMSPEQARGDSKTIGAATDIYSLGVVMYELLCGQRPFSGTVTEVIGQILHVDAPPPSQFREGVDPRLQAICLKAIAKQSKDRYPSMKALATALAEYQATAATISPTSSATAAESPELHEPLHTRQIARLVSAVSADMESKVNRAARRAVRHVEKKVAPPWWTYLIGSGVMGLIVLLGIFFFIRKDTVTVVVNIPIDTSDPALSFYLDERLISAAELASPIELKPGEHELVVNRDDKLFKRFRFNVGQGDNEPVAVQDVTPKPIEPPPVIADHEAPATEGWISLFNGKDLTGWKAVGPESWSVRDGDVFSSGKKPGHLVCEQAFEDFELTGEVYAEVKGNGGVCFRVMEAPEDGSLQRGGYEFQIAGSQGNPGPNFTGGLYAGKTPAKSVPKPIVADGVWSRIRILVQGTHLQGWVDDRPTFDVQGKSDRLTGRLLTLQSYAQGGETGYRHLRIRRLNESSNAGDVAGFVPLFQNDSLTGWQGQLDLWTLKDGVLTGRPGPKNGNTFLFSPQPYGDFDLRFQVRIADGDNSGVQIRSEVLDAAKWSARGPQCDIGNRPDDAWGGVYAESLPGGWLLKPAVTPPLKTGDWNDYAIHCSGRRVTIQVNGTTTADGEIAEMHETGLLAFQIHRTNQHPVEFRNLAIRVPNADNDPDRRAAAWVLGLQGEVTVRTASNQSLTVAQADQLPADAFQLISLNLKGHRFKNEDVRKLRGLQHIESIVMFGSQSLDDVGLAWLAEIPTIKQLSIGGNPITADGLAVLTKLKNLHRLEVSNNPRIDDASLKHVVRIPNLHDLQINGTPITDDGIRELVKIKRLKNLEISGTKITGVALDHLATLPDLGYLQVNNTLLTDVDAARFQKLPALTALHFFDTKIGDDGLKSVGKLVNLRHLVISKTPTTDKGIAHLTALKKLEMLWLWETQVTDACIEDLGQLTAMGHMDIARTKITPEGQDRLQQLLPQATITPKLSGTSK